MEEHSTTYAVSGTVTFAESGNPVPGVSVEIRDSDLLMDDTLGLARTDENGKYRIEFDEDDYQDLVFSFVGRLTEESPALYAVVKDDAGMTLASTADSVVSNPAHEETIDVVIPAQSIPSDDPPFESPMISIDGYEFDRTELEQLAPETLVSAARSLQDPSRTASPLDQIKQLNAELANELTRTDPNTRLVERIFKQLATEKNLDAEAYRELETAVDRWWMDNRRRCVHLPEELEEQPDDDDIHRVTQPLPSEAGQTWNSIALFFNFESASPDNYSTTTVSDAKEWLDEGADPAAISVSEFVRKYYDALSYGEHPISGIEAPRDENGDPKIPTIDVDGDPPGWHATINKVLQEVAADAWEAAGKITVHGTRWIPSVVLVQNYNVNATANFTGFEITVDGTKYKVGDRTHMQYTTSWYKKTRYRSFWERLCHEYSHNFVEFTDLYGPHGAMIYWDMLGDGSSPGNMSDIVSIHKEQAPGWDYSIEQVVEGGDYYNDHTLRPFATSGDALKIVPDPENNPYEYFVIEYRTSTGDEVWRPDGGLSEAGLLIVHVNERLKQLTGTVIPDGHWGTAVAPYIDAELADFEDKGMGVRSTKYNLDGTLYNGDPNRDVFGPETEPNSDFYGGRSSTLSISDITIADEEASFTVSLDAIPHRKLWSVSANDRGLAGRFTTSDRDEPAEVFMRDDDSVALLAPRDGQWLVKQRQAGRIDDWNLTANDHEYVGDLDGDGRDEVFIRSDNRAGVLQWADHRFTVLTMIDGSIGQWDLTGNMALDKFERAVIADLDGDGQDEIFIRGDDRAGVLRLTDNGLTVESTQQNTIGQFTLSNRDVHRAGRFSAGDRDEIMVNGDDGLALLRWDDAAGRLDSVATHGNAVDDWELNPQLDFAVTDLDDDNRDEIYVRRTVRGPAVNEAGIFKWNGTSFAVAWSRQQDLKYISDSDKTLSMTVRDESYAGDFFPGTSSRGGILHVADDRVSFLTWEDDVGGMRVRYAKKGGWFTWDGETDLIVGEFHAAGPENTAGNQYVADHTASAFLHNKWGAGQLTMDFKHSGLDILGKPGITWLQPDYLVGLHEPSLVVTLHTDEPILDTASATLSATPRGVTNAEDWSIQWFDGLPDEGQSLGTTKPGETLTWSDLPSVDSTIVYARAEKGQDSLTDWIKVSIRKSSESYARDSDPANSGYVKADGTVVMADVTDELIVGDDQNNVASHALLTFDLSTLPNDVDAEDIASASLDIILLPPEGTPYADLLDLSVVHVDYGTSLDAQDYRTKNLTFRPGRTVVEYDGQNNWGRRSVDVKRAVQDAIRHRTQLGQSIQFAIYHRTGTDNDNVADYTRVQSEHEIDSSHHSRLHIDYDNTPN